MHPERYLALQRLRDAELRAEARACRLGAPARIRTPGLRIRLGWALVEVGLRLASAPEPNAAR